MLLWKRGERATSRLDTNNMKDLSFMAWCKSQPTLAVGTAKGNLLIFNEKLGKRIPIMGKHQRKIVCGAWTPEDKLLLAAEDKQASFSPRTWLYRMPIGGKRVGRRGRGKSFSVFCDVGLPVTPFNPPPPFPPPFSPPFPAAPGVCVAGGRGACALLPRAWRSC